MLITKGKGRAILPQGISLVQSEASTALATRLTAACKWMDANAMARCDGESTSLAYAKALQRQRHLEKEME